MRTLSSLHQGHNGFSSLLVGTSPAATCPEALCSVNGYFHVDGFSDRFQATGRGSTAKEAAANLQGTMEETRAALEAKPVPAKISREEQLDALYTCWLKRAVSLDDYDLVKRLKKAVDLVQANAVSPGEREGMMAVQSQSTPAHWYEVDGKQCSCPDYLHRHQDGDKAFLCKHSIAVELTKRIA